MTSLTRLFSPGIKVDEKNEDIQTMSTYLKVKEICTEEMKSFLRFVEKKIENGHQTLQAIKDVAQYGAKRLLVAPVSTLDCERGFF